MRKRLVVGAALAALLVAWFMARRYPAGARAASPNLTIQAAAPLPGCPLGPAFTFCNQIPKTNSAAANFTLTANVAVSSLSASLAAIPGLTSDFAAGDFTIEPTSTCTGSLGAGKTCTVVVVFSPTTSGLRAAAVTVTDAAGDKAIINLQGTGANLTLTAPTPPACGQSQDNAFTYCDEAPTNTSGPQTFTLKAGSGGASNISIALAAASGLSGEFNASDFTVVANTCTALGAGGSCTFGVEFSPAAASTGLRTAVLTVTDTDAAPDTATIYLAGHTSSFMVLVPPTTTPVCSIGSAFEFCNEPTGGNTSATNFTLQNTSGTTLQGVTVPSASVNSNFKVTANNCTATMDAGTSCTISVEFTPQQTGLVQDSLSVTDNADDIAELNLAGTGDDYTLALAASQPLEVTVADGGTATFNAQVTPDAVLGLNGEQMTFVCPTNLPTNTSCSITPCPATLTAGTATAFSIKFVTSTATVVAPVPTAPCSGYGPQITPSSLTGPGPVLRWPRAPESVARRGRFPAPWSLATFCAMFLGLVIFVALGGLRFFGGPGERQGRLGARWLVGLALAGAAAVAVLVAAGCHHGAAKLTPETPAGATTMELQGNALDAQGNPLNASRSLEVILNVTAP